MASLNKVMLIGHLGRDPEVKYMPDGTAVANYSMATTRKWKDKQGGEAKEETEWHRIVAYGRQAEVVGEYLKKGALVYVEGRIRTRKWEDREGTTRYTTEIISEQMTMLNTRPGSRASQESQDDEEAAARERAAAAGEKKPAGKFDDLEDDIPF